MYTKIYIIEVVFLSVFEMLSSIFLRMVLLKTVKKDFLIVQLYIYIVLWIGQLGQFWGQWVEKQIPEIKPREITLKK